MKHIKDILFTIILTIILSASIFAIDAPRIISNAEIRSASPMGLRVKAVLSAMDASDKNTAEYGFLVTRKVFLSGNGFDIYDLDFDCKVFFSKGIAKGYENGERIDKFFDKNDNELYFAGHFYGIEPYYYTDTLVTRPYIITSFGTFYGDPIEMSIYSAAKSVFDNEIAYSSLTQEQQNLIREIVVSVDGEPYVMNSEDFRIVISSSVVKNSNPTYSVCCDIYNPYTGEIYENVKGRKKSKNVDEISAMLPEAGSIVPVHDGVIQDTTNGYIISNTSFENLRWVKNCDAENEEITCVPYNPSLECRECIEAYVTNSEVQRAKITAETPVTVYNKDTGTFELLMSGISQICACENSLLCYNITEKNTVYSDYIKAYSCVDGDGVNKFVIVVVNSNESSASDEKCVEHAVYDVTFEVDGTVVQSTKMSYGQTPQVPEAPNKEFFNFIGWSVDGEAIVNPENLPIMQNTAYKAVFKGVMHMVSFYAGTYLYREIETEHAKSPDEPESPEKAKSTFVGWSEEVGGETVSLADFPILSDITFYAKYESDLEDPDLITMLTAGKQQLEDLDIDEGIEPLYDEARNLMVKCISYVLVDAKSGIYIDTQYIFSTYPDMAQSIRDVLKVKMSKKKRAKFVNMLTYEIEEDVYKYIMKYFGITREDLDI